ncbi:pyridoxal phosphate-dependent decarboxylase family protein [Streptomyces sp. MMBL 11-3]|uniref:pyridoxal phosphate-dependent decarboxylase family protein n=1 Tax=Streptomyces sp. MMBL 11-3 TaxID=3382639 RepID=UPI0039B50242
MADSPQNGLLIEAFDVQLFRDSAESVLAKLEKHLADLSIRGLELADPTQLTRSARALMTTEHTKPAAFDGARLAEIVDLYIGTGIQVHSPGYMGRQFSGVVPLSGVIDFVSSVVNQPSSFYEAGQLPNVVERIMADELNEFIGFEPGTFSMITTSGGSLANLTALLTARNKAFPQVWARGGAELAGPARPAVAVGADVHYSVARAAGVLGIGEDCVVRLPLDAARRIDTSRIRPALDEARRQGLAVFCLVASAGTTSVGAFDPLDELAAVARERGLWLHVDGAHGAGLLVSDELRHKLRGIDQVDSLAWDAHKMMFVPAPCTLLFYRDRESTRGTFRQTASYVFDEQPTLYTAFDSGDKNFECTKRPMIMPLWVTWAMYGKALFAEKIEYLCRLTKEAYALLEEQEDFETPHFPEANIICFRYRPDWLDEEDLADFQVNIRNRVKERGMFFISKVDIDGVAALRVVMMNHQVTIEHFRMLLDEIRKAGQPQ